MNRRIPMFSFKIRMKLFYIIFMCLSCQGRLIRQESSNRSDETENSLVLEKKNTIVSIKDEKKECALKKKKWDNEVAINSEKIFPRIDLESIFCSSTRYLFEINAFPMDNFVRDENQVNNLFANLTLYTYPLLEFGTKCIIVSKETEFYIRTWDNGNMNFFAPSDQETEILGYPLKLYFYEKTDAYEKIILIFMPYRTELFAFDGDILKHTASGSGPYVAEIWLLLGRNGLDKKWRVRFSYHGRNSHSICNMVNIDLATSGA